METGRAVMQYIRHMSKSWDHEGQVLRIYQSAQTGRCFIRGSSHDRLRYLWDWGISVVMNLSPLIWPFPTAIFMSYTPIHSPLMTNLFANIRNQYQNTPFIFHKSLVKLLASDCDFLPIVCYLFHQTVLAESRKSRCMFKYTALTRQTDGHFPLLPIWCSSLT